MADKRKAQRKINRFPLTFQYGAEEYIGISSNFSATGLFIRTRKHFKTGLPVRIVFPFDKDRTVDLNGVISRTKIRTKFETSNCGIGVQLTETPQEYKDFLEFLVKKNCESYSDNHSSQCS